MPRRSAWLALAAVLLGLACLLYAGPGRAVVRGHVGDVAAAMFLHAALGVTAWPRRWRVAAALLVAVAVELGQTIWSPIGRSGVGALLIGSVFDPWDLVAYVAGVGVGVAWEEAASRDPARPGSGTGSRGGRPDRAATSRGAPAPRGP